MFDEAERIIISECLRHGVPIPYVKSTGKTRSVARCRAAIVARLRVDTDLSWKEIGLVLGRSVHNFRGSVRPVPPRP